MRRGIKTVQKVGQRPIVDNGNGPKGLPSDQESWEMVEKVRVGAACAPLRLPEPASPDDVSVGELIKEYAQLGRFDLRRHQVAANRAMLFPDGLPKEVSALSRSDLQTIAKIAWGTAGAYGKVAMDGWGAGTWEQITTLRISLTTVVMMLHRQMVEGEPSPDRRVWDQASINHGSSGWLLARVFIETAWGLIKVWTEDQDHYVTRFPEEKAQEPVKEESKPISIVWTLVNPLEKQAGAKLVKDADLRDKVLRLSKEIRDQYFGYDGNNKGYGIYEVGEPVDLERAFTCGKYRVQIPLVALI
jgi:hypothetical protein